MKILYVITGLGLGGAEKMVVDLADQMVFRGHAVKIAYLKGDVLVRPESTQVELIYLGLESVVDFFSASKKYRKLVRDYQPDIVHAHMVHANLFARINRIGCVIPKLICSAHSSNEGGKFRMLAYKYTNFLSNMNTNVSQSAVDTFIKMKAFDDRNLVAIYNGIDLDKFSFYEEGNQRSQTLRLLSVGRFNSAKDYPNLLHALTHVIFKYPNIHLNIAGDGELRGEIECLIQNLNLDQHVTLLGRRNDISQLMQQADFLILSSKYEGLPTVLLEAMASGLNVISTDCGGSKEIMGDTGILVEKQDSNKLADGITQGLHWSKTQVENNRRLARDRIEKIFSLQTSVDNWVEVYESK